MVNSRPLWSKEARAVYHKNIGGSYTVLVIVTFLKMHKTYQLAVIYLRSIWSSQWALLSSTPTREFRSAGCPAIAFGVQQA